MLAAKFAVLASLHAHLVRVLIIFNKFNFQKNKLSMLAWLESL